MNTKRSNNIWKYLIAFLVPTFLVLCLCPNIDNDSWGVIAEGREIVEHGLYYTDQLSMHEGLSITVQNYGFAIPFYLIYTVFGIPGLYLTTIILNFIFMFIFYRLCMLLSGKNTRLSLIITSVVNTILAFGFIVTRAQMIDYILLTSLIYILEFYIKTKKTKVLFWIPLISLVLINVHATTWLMIFIIISVYLIDGVKKPELPFEGYNKKPIFLISIISFALGFLNPYGLKMITLILTSYGNTTFSNMIIELDAFRPFYGKNSLFFLTIIITITLYIFSKRKIKIRHLLLFFGFLALGLNTTKALSELTIVMLFPLADVYKDWHMPPLFDIKRIGHYFASWTAIATICLTASMMYLTITKIQYYPSPELYEAFNTLDNDTEGIDKKSLKIYVGYNYGGYAEFRGYRPYLDPRGEVFLEKNNHKIDIIEEWQDLGNGDIKKEEFLDKYHFDYLVTISGEKLHNLDSENYELIYSDNYDNDKSTVQVYKRIGNNDNES